MRPAIATFEICTFEIFEMSKTDAVVVIAAVATSDVVIEATNCSKCVKSLNFYKYRMSYRYELIYFAAVGR